MTLPPEVIKVIGEAIRAALVEIEQCSDISQGVEDDLRISLELLNEYEQEKREEY